MLQLNYYKVGVLVFSNFAVHLRVVLHSNTLKIAFCNGLVESWSIAIFPLSSWSFNKHRNDKSNISTISSATGKLSQKLSRTSLTWWSDRDVNLLIFLFTVFLVVRLPIVMGEVMSPVSMPLTEGKLNLLMFIFRGGGGSLKSQLHTKSW